MKKAVLILVLMLCVVFVAATVFAVPPGKTLTFDKSPMGVVTFSGQVHADAGLKCGDCHTKIFQMKHGTAKITAPHKAGENCFVCHKDGGKAFNFQGNCMKCHKK
jgi:c(7)-type cytochrome triheme protein